MLSRFVTVLALVTSSVFALTVGRAPAAQADELREVELLVIDTAGKPIEAYGWSLNVTSPRSMWSSAEPIKPRPAGRAKLSVPKPPAVVTIEPRAERYRAAASVTLPADLKGQPLRIQMTPLNEVVGRVLVEGVAVAGAQVELVQRDLNRLGDELVPGWWDGMYYATGRNVVTTDEQGGFRIQNDFPQLRYFAHAWLPGCSDAVAGPVTLGGPPVTVELGAGSSIEGRVLVKEGKSAAGVEVLVYRKKIDGLTSELGLAFKTTIDAEGRWKVDSLAPGLWMVALRVLNPAAVGLDGPGIQRCADVPWIFDAPRASTAHVELDLRSETLCTLDGALKVGDLIRTGSAELLLEPPLALSTSLSGVGAEGRFLLRARQPGRYRLVIRAGPTAGADKPVTDVVELAPGANTWKRELAPESWQARGVRLDKP